MKSRSSGLVSSALIIGLFALAVGGCTADAAEETADDEGAISHEAAAKELDLTTLLLQNEPASQQSVAKLGIRKWHVYASLTGTFRGVVAFATDAEKDVRYALVVDEKTGKANILAYDKNGQEKGAVVPKATVEALLVDFKALHAKLDAPGPTFSNAAVCGARIAAGLLAGVVIVGAASWVALEAGLIGIIATWAGPAALEGVGAGFLLHAGGAAVVAGAGAVVIVKTATADTVKICKAAAGSK